MVYYMYIILRQLGCVFVCILLFFFGLTQHIIFYFNKLLYGSHSFVLLKETLTHANRLNKTIPNQCNACKSDESSGTRHG